LIYNSLSIFCFLSGEFKRELTQRKIAILGFLSILTATQEFAEDDSSAFSRAAVLSHNDEVTDIALDTIGIQAFFLYLFIFFVVLSPENNIC